MTVVIFDVDDTLYQQIEPFRLAIEDVFLTEYKQMNVEISELYLSFRQFSDEVFMKTVNGQMTLADMRVYRIKETFFKHGRKVTDLACQLFQERYYHYQGCIELSSSMREVLDYLRKKDIPIGILTNGPTTHQKRKLEQLGLHQWVVSTKMLISESIGVSKPEVTAFRKVQEQFDGENNFIYVGDSYHHDVLGALSAGWQVIWLNKYNRVLSNEESKPDVELHEDTQMLKIIKKLIEK